MRISAGKFGKCAGGGRRSSTRAKMPLPAMIFGLGISCAVELIDVSPSGARLRGTALPRRGEDAEIEVERMRTLARVMWSRGDQCGIAFATPLPSFDLQRLRRAASLAGFSDTTVEQRRVLDDWVIGLAR